MHVSMERSSGMVASHAASWATDVVRRCCVAGATRWFCARRVACHCCRPGRCSDGARARGVASRRGPYADDCGTRCRADGRPEHANRCSADSFPGQGVCERGASAAASAAAPAAAPAPAPAELVGVSAGRRGPIDAAGSLRLG